MLRTQVKVQRFRVQLQQSGSCGAEAAVQEQPEIRLFTGRDSQRGPQQKCRTKEHLGEGANRGAQLPPERGTKTQCHTRCCRTDVGESHVGGTGRNRKITQGLRAAREYRRLWARP